jgi:hypothetical protein
MGFPGPVFYQKKDTWGLAASRVTGIFFIVIITFYINFWLSQALLHCAIAG